MTENMSEPEHYVESIHSVFKIKIDNIEQAKKQIGKSIYKKEFTPSPGFVYQIKLRNIDSNKFSVSLKNCGKTSVQVKNFTMNNLRSYNYTESKLLLLPGNSVEMKKQEFRSFLSYNASRYKNEFVFGCSADIIQFILTKFSKHILYS
jgi:hypothetical protein